MADKKISQLTAKALAIAATDLVEISESDGSGGFVSKSVTGANIAALTTPSGITGAIQFSNGTALDSDATNLFYDNTNDRLGVGQNVPTARVHIKGTGTTNATTSLLVQNSAGTSSLQCTDDLSVFSHGKGAVATNTVFGKGALQGGTATADCTAIGVNALSANSSVRNTAIGSNALKSNTAGFNNTAVGHEALFTQTSPSQANTAVGAFALRFNTGSTNTAVGAFAGQATTVGNDNTFVGYNAAAAATSGTRNTAIGSEAATLITAAYDNVAVGYQALKGSSVGFHSNTAIGLRAMDGILTAAAVNNVAIGRQSANGLLSGADNVIIGAAAVGTGSSNTVIGKSATSSTFAGCLVLGAGATATAANQCVFGSTTINAGTVAAETPTQTQVWNVVINGVAHKILLA